MEKRIISGNSCLLDTSVWVSLIDRLQETHQAARDAFRNAGENIITTEAVLTETLHLLKRVKEASDICLDYILKGPVELVPLDKPDLDRIRTLMNKYSDVPMDFADATLVTVAEDLGINNVLTLDRRGFEAYRIYGSKPFNILP